MPIERVIGKAVLEAATQSPVVTITGPRQSGKTTLCRMLFPQKPYINLEDPSKRAWIESDPEAFFRSVPDGAVIDEVQRLPSILSYIQMIVDEKKEPGRFVLTGSAQFSLMEGITQSLAGRTALITLLPFSFEEAERASGPADTDAMIHRGFYPRIIAENLPPASTYADYFHTYVERDLRMLSQIHNLSHFERFVRLCAGRVGQLVDLTGLGADAGVSHTTAGDWLTLLQASYIVFTLQPYFRNISRRLVKTPKLYFFDAGLAAWLIGIERQEQLAHHPLRGNLFENMVISELLKHRMNGRRDNNLFFFRDQKRNECDLVYTAADNVLPMEIKSGETFSDDFSKGVRLVCSLFPAPAGGMVVYGGSSIQSRGDISVIPFRDVTKAVADREPAL